MRQALEEVDPGGQTVAPGEFVALVLGAANRDPQAYPDPDRLDLRRNGERHPSFGFGNHFHLGAPLAPEKADRAHGDAAARARP